MKTTQLLKKLNAFPKSYFTFSDLQKFYDGNRENLKVVASRLVADDKLIRLLKGYYTVNASRVDWEQFAGELLQPSYISLEYALWRYGMIDQIPTRVTLITTKKGRTYENILGQVIEYAHIANRLYFGYKIEGNMVIAEKEKALIDELYLMSLKKRSLSLEEIDVSGIDTIRLKKWLRKFPVYTQRLWEKLHSLQTKGKVV